MMAAATSGLCRRHLFFITQLGIRHHRNTRIKHYDIPPDKSKPLPLNTLLQRSDGDKIVVPRKTPRDSLSILRALAATVKKDPTASHYMYMDDPYMLPTDNMSYRNYALAKASGRKVAQHMITEYSSLVEEITVAHPHATELMPKPVAYVTTEPCEGALIERLERRKVEDAYDVYKAMKRGGVRPTQPTHLRLLDLLCVYNSRDPPDTLVPEEFWFRRDLQQEEFSKRQRWQINGLAEEVFEDLDDRPPAAYNTLLRGFAHYRNNEKALEYYQFANDNGIRLERGTYEKMLMVNHYHLETSDERLSAVQDMLRDYHAASYPPSLAIFNAALSTAQQLNAARSTQSFCLAILAEMRRCDIEPSLGSWHHVLMCFYTNANSQSHVLYEIMDHLENREISLCHASDVEFFFTAMSKCTKNLHDIELAYRIDALLTKGDANQLLSNSFYLIIYYATFFRLVCSVDTWDNIIALYNRIVPHIFIPNPKETIGFLETLDLNDKHDFIPTIFTDIVIFGLHKKPDVLSNLLRIMAKKPQSADLQEKFAEIVREVRQLTEQDEADRLTRVKLQLTGDMLGHLALLACRVSDIDLAWYFIEKWEKLSKVNQGYPSEECLLATVDLCIEKQDTHKALTCLSLMAELSFPKTADTAELITSSLPLDVTDRYKVDSLVQR